MRILSVDDNPENLYLVEMIGRSKGHEVISASNGREALRLLAGQDFDLIISDVLMPEMDGFQLCRMVKNDDRLKRIPLIFYTATYTAEQDEQLGLSLGASRFIVKPMDPEEFIAIMEQVVREGEVGDISVPAVDLDDEGKSLSLYNQRLVRKLEQKIQQLEAARSELAASLADREREIGQRRKAEHALAQSEEQFRLIWERSTDGMVLTDSTGTVLRANPSIARMFAKPLDEFPGKLFTFAFAPGAESMLVNYRQRLEARSIEGPFERQVCRWDLEQIWVEGSRTMIDLPSEPVVFTILRDVTGRKRAEEQRRALEAQLLQAQKLESVGRLAGGVAHDFNNLLTVIDGYSQLLLEGLHEKDPLREGLEQIHQAGVRAARLTRQLLAFSRKQVLQPRLLDVNRVVDGMRTLLTRMVGEDVELSVQLDAKPALVRADPYQIEQVLMNLAVNSRDAMPGGGTLRIETKVGRRNGDPTAVASSGGAYVELSVCDSGEGMTEETRQHLFEPFFTTKETGKGTGLGLSTVQGIVAQSGGFIEVESALGRGATFRVFLPLSEDALREPAAAAGSSAVGGQETILVVEDQEDVCCFVVAALKRLGYRVLSTEDAEAAQLLCESEHGAVDLLLTDVVMPRSTGKELADRLRTRWPALKVLFMSGYAEDAILRAGIPAEQVHFIQKPFAPAELAAKVREVLLSHP